MADDSGSQRILREARAKVKWTAIGLMVVGALSLLGVAFDISNYSNLEKDRDDVLAQVDLQPNVDPQTRAFLKDILDVLVEIERFALPPMFVSSTIIAAITLLAGVRLRQFRSPGLVKVGAVLSMLPLSATCLLGLFAGFFALRALKDPIVTKAYQLTAEAAKLSRVLEE